MTDYSKQAEIYEAKQESIKNGTVTPPTFEENVSKLLQLSKDKFKSHYENQIATYKEYVQYLKEMDGNTSEANFFEGLIAKNMECVAYVEQNIVLSYLSKQLQPLWSEGDVLKMIAFQDHCTDLMNQYFKDLEQMVEIDKYIDENTGMTDNPEIMGRVN